MITEQVSAQVYQLLSQYSVTNPRIALLEHQGLDSVVYGVQIGRKSAVLKIATRKKDIESLQFEIELSDLLAKARFPTYRFLRTRTNKAFVQKDDVVVTLMTKLSGEHIAVSLERAPDNALLFTAGATLGQFHQLTSAVKLKSTPRRTMFAELERINSLKSELMQMHKNGAAIVRHVETYISWGKAYAYSDGIIHNDFAPQNIFFDKSKVNVLDLDWSCYGDFIKDTAHAVVLWAFPDWKGVLYEEAMHTFIKGYNSSAPRKLKIDKNFYQWAAFSCLSDASTHFADRVKEGKLKADSVAHTYQKFLFFHNYL